MTCQYVVAWDLVEMYLPFNHVGFTYDPELGQVVDWQSEIFTLLPLLSVLNTQLFTSSAIISCIMSRIEERHDVKYIEKPRGTKNI